LAGDEAQLLPKAKVRPFFWRAAPLLPSVLVRVTRLGAFSPTGWLFPFGSFLKIKK
jgi:hypothetical protein